MRTLYVAAVISAFQQLTLEVALRWADYDFTCGWAVAATFMVLQQRFDRGR